MPLFKRDWFYDDDWGNGWYDWGRWVLLGVIVGIAILSFIFLQVTSCRRARHGQMPIRGTAWMVPPSYYQATQQNPEDAVPVYRQKAGYGDAGYYDQEGNFIPLQHNMNMAEGGNGYSGPGQSSGVYPGGTVGAVDSGNGMAPPPPENAYTRHSAASQYYPPPPGPPPGRSSIEKVPHTVTTTETH